MGSVSERRIVAIFLLHCFLMEASDDEVSVVTIPRDIPFIRDIPSFVYGPEAVVHATRCAGVSFAPLLSVRLFQVPMDHPMYTSGPHARRFAIMVPHTRITDARRIARNWLAVMNERSDAGVLRAVQALWGKETEDEKEEKEEEEEEEEEGVWPEQSLHITDYVWDASTPEERSDHVRSKMRLGAMRRRDEWIVMKCPNVYIGRSVGHAHREKQRKELAECLPLRPFRHRDLHELSNGDTVAVHLTPRAINIKTLCSLWGLRASVVMDTYDGSIARALDEQEDGTSNVRLRCSQCPFVHMPIATARGTPRNEVWSRMKARLNSETWGLTPAHPYPLCDTCGGVMCLTSVFARQQIATAKSHERTMAMRKYPFQFFVFLTPEVQCRVAYA